MLPNGWNVIRYITREKRIAVLSREIFIFSLFSREKERETKKTKQKLGNKQDVKLRDVIRGNIMNKTHVSVASDYEYKTFVLCQTILSHKIMRRTVFNINDFWSIHNFRSHRRLSEMNGSIRNVFPLALSPNWRPVYFCFILDKQKLTDSAIMHILIVCSYLPTYIRCANVFSA